MRSLNPKETQSETITVYRDTNSYPVRCLWCPCSSLANHPPSRLPFPQTQKAEKTIKRAWSGKAPKIYLNNTPQSFLSSAHQLFHCGRTFRAQTKGSSARPKLDPRSRPGARRPLANHIYGKNNIHRLSLHYAMEPNEPIFSLFGFVL